MRWFMLHQDVTVHVDEGDWYISIGNRCKMLGLDNRCQAYETRPNICRKYDPAQCDHTGGDYGYDVHFRTADELDACARKTLGPAKFNRARAKARGLTKTTTKKRKRRDKDESNDKQLRDART